MKRLAVCILAVFCWLGTAAQERYCKVELGLVDQADTLRWCWFDSATKDGHHGLQLAQEYNDLYVQRMQYHQGKAEVSRGEGEELQQQLDEQDAYWENLRKLYQQMLKQEGLSAEERRELQKNIDSIDAQKAESRRQVEGTIKAQANEGREQIGKLNPSDFSDERMLALKREIRKYVLGRKIWGFDRVRDFRNGFAAVCYATDENAGDRWGFINRKGRLVVPCIWNEAYDFNNRRHYRMFWNEEIEDEDTLPWTSVRKGQLVGMIDTTGTVRIPVKFRYTNRAQIVFKTTGKGEIAAARDAKSGKWGLIDRKGEWVIRPVYHGLEWSQDDGCFIYCGADDVYKNLVL